MKLSKIGISALWFYRLVRLGFGAFFIAVGFIYKDAWITFVFGAIFIATAFIKSPRCIDESCENNPSP